VRARARVQALQLDPHNAYAYTLCGHEYVANEDFDKAVGGFRQAIGVDARHYNAWYGLANIFFRQEKHELARYHYGRALAIHARSSVLHCQIGTVLIAQKKYADALAALETAGTYKHV
jgi:anaphase-promoting complex subunit 3